MCLCKCARRSASSSTEIKAEPDVPVFSPGRLINPAEGITMDGKTALERAFELGDQGLDVSEIRIAIHREGYEPAKLYGVGVRNADPKP